MADTWDLTEILLIIGIPSNKHFKGTEYFLRCVETDLILIKFYIHFKNGDLLYTHNKTF